MIDPPPQLVTVPAVPPKVTPPAEPKPLPEMITEVPPTVDPLLGAIPEIPFTAA